MDSVALCQRLNLTLIDLRTGAVEGSRFVARVRDETGYDLALKVVSGERGRTEIDVARAWSIAGLPPAFCGTPEPGVYLSEWLPGLPLADAGHMRKGEIHALGRTLRTLHGITPPANIRVLRERFRPGQIGREWPLLTPPMRAAGELLAAALFAYAGPNALLHGDLVPANVILAPTGPAMIDPVGYVGLPAWDIAQLAVAWNRPDRRATLDELARGYGSEPPLLAEMFGWMVLLFLHKNLELQQKTGEDRSVYIRALTPLAEAVASLGTPPTLL